jgi:hypothetical protein
MSGNMVQFGLWANCSNSCDFCLLKNKTFLSKPQMIQEIHNTRKNIDIIDWCGKFSYGISLLGGELYHITDADIQQEFMLLVDDIIEKILKKSPNRLVRYSTVTNGIYNPEFLFRVIDKIVSEVGIDCVDVNFSYDLKYRFKNDECRKLVLENINKFHQRYDYSVGVQMILTQFLIDMVRNKEFDINDFMANEIPGNMLCLLYPHTVRTGKILEDFNFKRNDFLWFLQHIQENSPEVYRAFVESTRNSGIFKYTGLYDKGGDTTQEPVLSDDKEIINQKCGHSVLYQCYADSDKCMLCDINNYDE